jgi:adenylosuccinate lyase
MSFFMDQISEHQRDLTNSASGRFIADYVAGFCAAANRTLSVLRSLTVNRERMLANLQSGGAVLAEPAYILLAESGLADAHEIIRTITLAAEKDGLSFGQALTANPAARDAVYGQLKALGHADPAAFFSSPEKYNGLAAVKAREISARYDAVAARYKSELA